MTRVRWLTIAAVISASILVLTLCTGFKVAHIQGNSMSETFSCGTSFCLGVTVKASTPQRDHVYTFVASDTLSRACGWPLGEHLIKRAAGIPGDTVTLHDGSTHVLQPGEWWPVGDGRDSCDASVSREPELASAITARTLFVFSFSTP